MIHHDTVLYAGPCAIAKRLARAPWAARKRLREPNSAQCTESGMSSNHLEQAVRFFFARASQAAHLEHTTNANPSKNMRKRASRNAAPTQPNQLKKKKLLPACCMPPQNSHRGLSASDSVVTNGTMNVHISSNGTIPQNPSKSMEVLIKSI